MNFLQKIAALFGAQYIVQVWNDSISVHRVQKIGKRWYLAESGTMIAPQGAIHGRSAGGRCGMSIPTRTIRGIEAVGHMRTADCMVHLRNGEELDCLEYSLSECYCPGAPTKRCTRPRHLGRKTKVSRTTPHGRD